jgi:biotin carboxyl carrier protein
VAYVVCVDNREFKVDVKHEGNRFIALLNGKKHNIEITSENVDQITMIMDNTPFVIIVDSDDQVVVNGESYSVSVTDESTQKLIKSGPVRSHKKELVLKAVMPGLVIEVNVKEGDSVKSGDALLVIEAMKMQNEVKTPQDGLVKKILVQKGKTVNSGDTLIIIE